LTKVDNRVFETLVAEKMACFREGRERGGENIRLEQKEHIYAVRGDMPQGVETGSFRGSKQIAHGM
jgi:hypothetical protein